MYYPLVVEQYGRLTLLDKKEVIPLIINDGITELFDVVEKDLIKAKARYSWEPWPEIELGKLQQKKSTIEKITLAKTERFSKIPGLSDGRDLYLD